MRKVDLTTAKTIANTKGLLPSRVIGTSGLQFSGGHNANLEPVSWEEFEGSINSRGLAIYEQGGWLKLMRTQ